ncbi:hypothetical protein ACRAWF_24155 [Streptomyces sp. L7]
MTGAEGTTVTAPAAADPSPPAPRPGDAARAALRAALPVRREADRRRPPPTAHLYRTGGPPTP